MTDDDLEPPEQLEAEALFWMQPDEIAAARKAGRLDYLLGRIREDD